MALARTLADLNERSPKSTYLIVGMMNQKDVKGFLEPFSGLVKATRTIAIPGEQNGAIPADLVEVANELGIPSSTADNLEDALKELDGYEDQTKRVLICGSLYLAGHVLKVAGVDLFNARTKK